MKILLGAALGALMLAGPAMAATLASPTGQRSAGIEVANTVSTPSTYGNGNSQAVPNFNYRASVPVTASVQGAAGGYSALPDSTMRLVNQTGSGH